MTSELVLVTDPEQIAALPVEERGVLITRALEESKSWLAVATSSTDPTPIVEFRAWAATVAEMTRQKGLAEDIQLDALEMVRRAERGIGVAIRNGQEAGVIAKPGDIGAINSPGTRGARSGSPRNGDLVRPGEAAGVKHPSELTPLYAAADGISDEQFDDAIVEARQERNLARANVLRKAKGQTAPVPASRQIERIAEMAAQGHTSWQIATAINATRERVHNVARANNIDIPADVIIRGTHHIVPERVIRETVHGLEGYCDGLKLLDPDDYNQLNPDDVKTWSSSLTESLRALRNLQKELNRLV